MLEVITNHLGAVQFEITARKHKIYSDQPVEQGGFDEGMTPPELMLASLGACAAYYAVDYFKRSQLPAEGVRVRTTAEKVLGPPRLDQIHIELECAGVLTEPQQRQEAATNINDFGLVLHSCNHPRPGAERFSNR